MSSPIQTNVSRIEVPRKPVTTKFLPLAVGTAALLALWLMPSEVSACPTCKDGMHAAVAMAYAVSILFMMAMPFVIFTFWVVTIIRLRSNLPAAELDPRLILAEQCPEP